MEPSRTPEQRPETRSRKDSGEAEPPTEDGPRTVLEVLDVTAARHGDRAALRYKAGDPRRNGHWETLTWSDYRDRAWRVGRAFMALGVRAGQGVAIMGFNRPEWFLADLGAIACGAVPAGIYTTNPPEICRYIAEHAEATVVVVENDDYRDVFRALRDRLPELRAVVVMEGEADPERAELTWDELLDRAHDVPESRLRERIAAQEPDDVCTLIYTSGTTGPPKAVMLTHRNIVWISRRIVDAYDFTAGECLVSYLPLSHIAEQVVSLHCPMAVGATSWFAESLEDLRDNLLEVRPHFFFAVPRVWEKMQAAIQAVGAQAPPLRRRVAAWARRIGLRAGYAEQRGGSKPLLYPLAERLVFRKVRAKLGLERARVVATSTAPISRDTLDFFLSLGMPLLEVYGMSECTGPTTLSTPERYKTGSVGWPIPGTEVEIADDGEIRMRGPHVFAGYLKNPEATAEALHEDGWLHSGDIGRRDEDGFLYVTDRKKEILITSGGKNIAPQVVEAKLREIPGVAQAVAVGDGRKFISALLTLDPEALPELARQAGSPAGDPREAAACPKIRALLERRVGEANRDLARYETIKRFVVLPRELSIEEGELTPTMKLKRRVIRETWAQEIEGLYEGVS